ncbi:hypothetical protein [Bdellovibrio sp. GT3]|uniref:hypothetical protein n=1 Tax=Bdellovibrio sp. GT3 TaxID=3136282 RepID=UPI0030F10F4E
MPSNKWTDPQTIIAAFALIAAIYIGIVQNSINEDLKNLQDVVEIVATPGQKEKVLDSQAPFATVPIVALQNVGTVNIYLKGYFFNDSKYSANGTVLAKSSNIYHIDLPTNGTSKVSIELYYEDSLGRKWITNISATRNPVATTSPIAIASWNVSNVKRKEVTAFPEFQ